MELVDSGDELSPNDRLPPDDPWCVSPAPMNQPQFSDATQVRHCRILVINDLALAMTAYCAIILGNEAMEYVFLQHENKHGGGQMNAPCRR